MQIPVANDTFGSVITTARKALGLSRHDVWRTLGLSNEGEFVDSSFINALEHDRIDPRGLAIIDKLAEVLHLDVSVLASLADKHEDSVRIRRGERLRTEEAIIAFRRSTG